MSPTPQGSPWTLACIGPNQNALVGGVGKGVAGVLWRCCQGMQKTYRVGWEEKRFPANAQEGPLVG